MKIGLLGFGTVGSHFYALTQGRSDLTVTAVLSRRPRPELRCTVTADFFRLLHDPEIDTIVEVMGGLEPAHEYVCAALRAGKHVVTANKQLMCAYYDELVGLARENGVCLRCTAAAGGGIPWLTSLSRAARLDEITAVEGILNGTTNYMLSEMSAHGTDYAEALSQAQQLGYAEADPTADVEGLDARRKIALSANIAFGVSLPEEEIPCAGISAITAEDIRQAAQRNLTFRLIARAARAEEGVAAFVAPTLFPAGAPEAHVGSTGNRVALYARRIGMLSFAGFGAGGWPTGSSVLADCVDISGGCESFYTDSLLPCHVDNAAEKARWLIRSKDNYFTLDCSAASAFAAYELYRKDDPRTLLARLADGVDWESC